MSEGDQGFFRSRWVDRPEGIEELEPTALAPGFRAAGVACGLKASGGTDVGIVVCDEPEVASSLLLTRNAAAAAPVRVCRDRCDRGRLRAAVVNSGNANAATGEQGYRDAVAMQERAARALGLRAGRGLRGRDRDDRRSARRWTCCSAASTSPRGSWRPDGGGSFSAAIMTTDRGPKRCAVTAGGVTLSAQAKGAGMIEPGFATMLCFVQTDAVIADPDTDAPQGR